MKNTKKAKRTTTPTPARPTKVASVAGNRRVFAVGQCHHRDAKSQPDCNELIVAKRANLCPPHEREWQKAARVRYASKATVATTKVAGATDGTPAPTGADDLEAQLAASNARFATPQLAAQARAKRQSQSVPN